MPVIQLSSRELSSREQRIRQLLQPLSSVSDGPACQRRTTSSDWIIGTHDGSPPSSNYRDWRFATIAPNFRGMYFEFWKRINDKHWCLHQAYLHIYKRDPTRQEIEYLCLHCDPLEADNAPHALYKQGPHLHITVAEDPIPHAHIALNRGHLSTVLTSVQTLSEAMQLAILMLREQVFDALVKQ